MKNILQDLKFHLTFIDIRVLLMLLSVISYFKSSLRRKRKSKFMAGFERRYSVPVLM